MANEMPILYYWAPCTTCALTVDFATKHGVELDKRDVEQEGPYMELLELGGDANKIPYLYSKGELICGVEAIEEFLTKSYL